MTMFNLISERKPVRVLVLLFTLCALATDIPGQNSAQEGANALRAQLLEVQAKQESLEARLRYLEEELKPENIEKSLAGIGSTHPEDLREFRRRHLELQKMSIETQLRLLAESKTRLEARIAQAEADAYHQSASDGVSTGESQPPSAEQSPPKASSVQLRERRTKTKPKRRRIRRLTQG